LITNLKSDFVISPKLSEEQAHLEQKSACSWQVNGRSQADNPKQKVYSSVSVMTLSGF